MKPIVQSQKHYVQISRSSVAVTAVNSEDLLLVTTVPSGAVDNVKAGSVVKAVYIELWVIDSGNDGSGVVVFMKNEASSFGPTFAQMNALGTFDEKKNIFFTHQGLMPNDGITAPRLVMRQWYKIPKSKQRMGLGDSLRLFIANNNTGSALNYCGFATYKEYT